MTIPPRDDDQVIVTTKGEVSEAAKAYAASKVGRLHQHAHGPVLLTRVKLTYAEGEDVERNAIAEAAMDVDGRLVRGQVATHRIEEAVDLLVDRMIRQLDQAAAKARTRERRPSGEPAPRPGRVIISPEEREVVAHKSFAIDRATLEEAAFDMEVLDYDFFLFTEADDGRDKVVFRGPEGDVQLATGPPTETVEEALERLDAGGEPFVFFCDADTGRGAVAYLRYDGHYGLIRPADG
ncbi:MAG TPA: HPF/RaiA family ribosome-associated protein [Acidimicrobiales bacterium]|nr:HPF/RaiA family ribosome-associated protein [Acidimicrobiales bacterium]